MFFKYLGSAALYAALKATREENILEAKASKSWLLKNISSNGCKSMDDCGAVGSKAVLGL